jgi:TolA-binding protein
MNDERIWELHNVKQQITALNKEVNNLEATRSELEEAIMEELNDANLSLVRTNKTDESGKRITVSVNTETVANVDDWAEFEEYVYQNRALYLLQRRPSNPSYREELAAKGKIPGVEPFTKQRLSLKHV